MDNNTFWDPQSIDTLIFNSYLGSACIFEYRDGIIEVLRVNDKYIRMLNRLGMTAEVALKLDWNEHMDEQGRTRMSNELKRAELSGEEETSEFVFLKLPGCAEKIYLRLTMRVIATTESRKLVYCTDEDITEQRLSEQKRFETSQQLMFLNDIAHDLLSQTDPAESISVILHKLLEFFCGTRAYIFEFDFSRRCMCNTYEICADGISREKDSLQNIPFDDTPLLFKSFEEHGYYNIEKVDNLDDSNPEKALLQMQKIESLVIVPLRREGKIIGYVGIDEPHKKLNHIELISALGDYIAVILTRRDLISAVNNENQEKIAIMDGIPGGFVRMRVNDDGTIKSIYRSQGFLKLVGMDMSEIQSVYGENSLQGVHPDDISIVKDSVSIMLRYGEVHNVKYRLRKGGGGYVWVTIFGKMRKNEAGETYLNVYYAEATELKNRQDAQIELLDNLPCGAALYEFDGVKLTAIHINRRYWELVGRRHVDYKDINIQAAIHPDDWNVLIEAMKKAILQNSGIICKTRILTGSGEYRMFHIEGRILIQDNGKYVICTSYTPVSLETLSYKDIFPVILSAIMNSTSDLSFVKDSEMRYITASRAFLKMIGLENESDVIGKTDYELFEKSLADKYRFDDNELLKSGKSIIDKLEAIPSSDGVSRYSETSKYLLFDADDNVVGLYGVGRDITHMLETDLQLKLLSDNLPCGLATYICIKQNESAFPLIYLSYFNDGFCKLFELDRSALNDRCFFKPERIIFDEDLPELKSKVTAMIEQNAPLDAMYRVHMKGGNYKWISQKSKVTERKNNTVTINAVLLDVTEQQIMTERLRISEEENRLAIKHTGNIICRFLINSRTLELTPEVAALCGLPEKNEDMPYGMIKRGFILPESQQAYIDFYEEIIGGGKTGSVVFQCNMPSGARWLEDHYSTVFSDGKPVFAVISFSDVTERQEKEMIYKKWQQSMHDKAPDSYTLFRCDISRNVSSDTKEGNLLKLDFDAVCCSFNDRTLQYAKQYVADGDREEYVSLLNSDSMIANYYRGVRYKTFEYREKQPDGSLRWLRLTVELVEYPNSSDIEAYMLYENIDADKKKQLQMQLLAETDSLTSLFNRKAFTEKMNALIKQEKPGAIGALMMFDIDGFKNINDSHGHETGDETLIQTGKLLLSEAAETDILGRLGGDEFIFYTGNAESKAAIAEKAEKMCASIRSFFKGKLNLTVSAGIAMKPENGDSFDILYRKADRALYQVKNNGKNGFIFYTEEINGKIQKQGDTV